MKHPDAPIIAEYLQTILRNTEKTSVSQASYALGHAAKNVATHLEGRDNKIAEFQEVIERYKTTQAA